jgi:hypothetical protein
MEDDSQIKRIDIRMEAPVPPEGLVYIELEEIEDNEFQKKNGKRVCSN